jgi:hypothetical protein
MNCFRQQEVGTESQESQDDLTRDQGELTRSQDDLTRDQGNLEEMLRGKNIKHR